MGCLMGYCMLKDRHAHEMLRDVVSEAFQTGVVASWRTERPPSPERIPTSALVTLLAKLQLMEAVAALMSSASEYCSAISLPCAVSHERFQNAPCCARRQEIHSCTSSSRHYTRPWVYHILMITLSGQNLQHFLRMSNTTVGTTQSITQLHRAKEELAQRAKGRQERSVPGK